MKEMQQAWISWLLLGGVLLAVNAAKPQPRRSHRQLFGLFGSSAPTVVNCMAETSASQVSWQNADFPANESLPGICTLTLNPADGTCAYRLHFDNLDLASDPSFLDLLGGALSCTTDRPYLKVSTVNYAAPAKCQDLTGYEGIVNLPKDSTEPVVLLLQTDPSVDFMFRVNISSVACDDIETFTSASVCGIRNQVFNERRSEISLAESTLLESEPKESAKYVNSVEVQKNKIVDTTLEEVDGSPVEITETLEKARKSRTLSDRHSADIHLSNPVYPDVADTDPINSEFRRLPVGEVKKKNKQKKKQNVKSQTETENIIEISKEAKDYAEQIKKAGNIFSYGIGLGIEKGVYDYQPREQNDTRFWWPANQPTNPNEWPWMVLIEGYAELFGNKQLIRCNGVLLDESHVITAATCLPGLSLLSISLDTVRVIIGAHDVPIDEDDTSIISTAVSKITFPMSYNMFEVKDDISVLTLKESVNFTDTVRPICVPVSYNNPSDELGIVTGWRVAQINGLSIQDITNLEDDSTLQTLEVKVIDKDKCNETISQYIAQISALTGNIPDVHPDDYTCTLNSETDQPDCNIGLGTPLFRQDITNAYYLSGVSGPTAACFTNEPNVFTAIKPDDTFLNLAVAG